MSVDIDAMTLAEQAAALRRVGYPDPLADGSTYIPTREEIERAVAGESPPPGWKQRQRLPLWRRVRRAWRFGWGWLR